MIAVYILAGVGLYFLMAWATEKKLGEYLVFMACWIFWVIPNARYMMWRLERRGWRNRVCNKIDGSGTFIDPDTWVHPDRLETGDEPSYVRGEDGLKGYTLYGAYQTLKKNGK